MAESRAASAARGPSSGATTKPTGSAPSSINTQPQQLPSAITAHAHINMVSEGESENLEEILHLLRIFYAKLLQIPEI